MPAPGRDLLGEGPAHDELLLPAGAVLLPVDAGDSAQFERSSHDKDIEPPPDRLGISGREIPDGVDPETGKATLQPGGDPPNLTHRQALHEALPPLRTARRPHAHAVEHLDLLGGHVRKLGERTGRCDPHADRDPQAPSQGRADVPAEPFQRLGIVCDSARDLQEGLVDAADLQFRGEAVEDAHRASRHVAVQLVVAGDGVQPEPFGLWPQLEPGAPQVEADRPGLLAGGDDHAVVVAQHDDRHPLEGRVEHPLEGHVCRVHVDVGDHRRRLRRWWMQ